MVALRGLSISVASDTSFMAFATRMAQSLVSSYDIRSFDRAFVEVEAVVSVATSLEEVFADTSGFFFFLIWLRMQDERRDVEVLSLHATLNPDKYSYKMFVPLIKMKLVFPQNFSLLERSPKSEREQFSDILVHHIAALQTK